MEVGEGLAVAVGDFVAPELEVLDDSVPSARADSSVSDSIGSIGSMASASCIEEL